MSRDPEHENRSGQPLPPPELLKQIRRLEIRTRRMVDELFGGEYHSVFKGRGVEFREVREYAIGDDVRSIDWNVTARTGLPHVKQYEEERELTVMLLADVSASQEFATESPPKATALAWLGALLAFAAVSNDDKVGAILFTDRVELYIPPKKGRRHALRILRDILHHPREGRGTDIRAALDALNRLQRRKAVCFLLSDFLAEGYDRSLLVSARRHDLTAVQFVDRRERQLERLGLVRLEDLETGRTQLVDTSDRRVLDWFSTQTREREATLDRRLRRAGCDRIRIGRSLSTSLEEDDLKVIVEPLQRFFMRRERRR